MKSKAELILYAKRRRAVYVIFLVLFTLLFSLCLLFDILFFKNVTLFFIFTASLIILLLFFFRLYPKVKSPLKIQVTEGEIIKVFSQKFEVNVMKTYNYSLVRRPYSKYYKDSFTLTLFIKGSGEKITPRTVSGVSESICGYYSVGDKVLLISGIKLPLPLEVRDKRSICPICGAIEPEGSHICK